LGPHEKDFALLFKDLINVILKGFFIYICWPNEPFYLGQASNGLDKLVIKPKNACK